jgi:glycosyltransferase involved in cell wall biosynthesis
MDTERTARPLRIALVAPPMLPVPPPTYAGTERVVAALADALIARGHRVTLYAAGDSTFQGELVPTVEQSLWSRDYRGDISAYLTITLARVWEDHARYDIIHSHVETLGFLFARHCPTPVVSTLHGRLDQSGTPELLEAFSDIPLVSISDSQGRFAPDANWVGTIHHGLPFDTAPFSATPGDYLAFVGRITPEKGIADVIELTRRTGLRLRMAAKVYDDHEQVHFDEVVKPALEDPDLDIDFLGEVTQQQRDPLYAGALATVMLGAWPEPFGLVAIESLATGTPVIARRAGGLTETIEHGVDGFLVDDVSEAELAVQQVRDLDRTRIRERALERFSPMRMAREYEAVYEQVIDGRARPTAESAGSEPAHVRPAAEPGAPAAEPESGSTGTSATRLQPVARAR